MLAGIAATATTETATKKHNNSFKNSRLNFAILTSSCDHVIGDMQFLQHLHQQKQLHCYRCHLLQRRQRVSFMKFYCNCLCCWQHFIGISGGGAICTNFMLNFIQKQLLKRKIVFLSKKFKKFNNSRNKRHVLKTAITSTTTSSMCSRNMMCAGNMMRV